MRKIWDNDCTLAAHGNGGHAKPHLFYFFGGLKEHVGWRISLVGSGFFFIFLLGKLGLEHGEFC